MSRTPLEVYDGLIHTELGADTPTHIAKIIGRFSDKLLAGEPMSDALQHFIELLCRHISYLEGRQRTTLYDLTRSIDILDYFSSTSKWWMMSRNEPGFLIRPAAHDPREFIISVSSIKFGSETTSRIDRARDRLTSFLNEHTLGDNSDRNDIEKHIVSSWTLLSGFSCKAQGRSTTNEADFEVAYDLTRILLFHTPQIDFSALTSLRQFATSPLLTQAAKLSLSPWFEKKLESSRAASIESNYEKHLGDTRTAAIRHPRSILTNSLRFLAQIHMAKEDIDRIEGDSYEAAIIGSFDLLTKIGINPSFFQEERKTAALFEQFKVMADLSEKLSLLTRKLESLILDSTGSRNFLLQNPRLVPRIIALLLLVSAGTKSASEAGLQDIDIKRGLILLSKLLND